nr:putative ribonuclease H-like domain-containing protein [Tanacetum cinerariifolium]
MANGHSQQFSVDCDDTFSHVVKSDTIHTVLSLALSHNWFIHQLDVKNAFFNGDLSKTVYMYQPPGYANMVGFSSSRCDSSLFIYQHGYEVAYLLIYVDDIVLTPSSINLLQRSLHSVIVFSWQIIYSHVETKTNTNGKVVDVGSVEQAKLAKCWSDYMLIDMHLDLLKGQEKMSKSDASSAVFMDDNEPTWAALV